MSSQSDEATVIRYVIEVNREDLERNDITKPPEEWTPEDLKVADDLGLVYAWDSDPLADPIVCAAVAYRDACRIAASMGPHTARLAEKSTGVFDAVNEAGL